MVNIIFLGDFFSINPNKIHLIKEFRSKVKSSDIAVVNLEGPIISENTTPLQKSGPNIAQNIDSIDFLKRIGFNVFSLGNNHAMDYGKDGLVNTIQLFEENETLGAGEYDIAYKVLQVVKNDMKIGFLSLCHFEFGMSESSNFSYGVAWINDPIVDSIIVNAKKNVDVLIILPHAGVEDIDIPLPEWRQRYRHFIDLGADAVIGGHPHVVQGKEIYKNCHIYYSLGNFFFENMDDDDIRHYHSLLLEMTVEKGGYVEFKERVVKRDGYDLRFLNYEDSIQYMDKLNSLISSETEYNSLLRDISQKAWEKVYKKQLSYALRKPILKYGLVYNLKIIVKCLLKRQDVPLLLNIFQCESHRWIVERALKNDNA